MGSLQVARPAGSRRAARTARTRRAAHGARASAAGGVADRRAARTAQVRRRRIRRGVPELQGVRRSLRTGAPAPSADAGADGSESAAKAARIDSSLSTPSEPQVRANCAGGVTGPGGGAAGAGVGDTPRGDHVGAAFGGIAPGATGPRGATAGGSDGRFDLGEPAGRLGRRLRPGRSRHRGIPRRERRRRRRRGGGLGRGAASRPRAARASRHPLTEPPARRARTSRAPLRGAATATTAAGAVGDAAPTAAAT